MGYSMGARIVAFLALTADLDRVPSFWAGWARDLVEGVGLPIGIADAMEAASLDDLTDPMQRMFRAFADQSGGDRRALAACIRGSRQTLSEAEVRAHPAPALVAVGSRDTVAGEVRILAAHVAAWAILEIPGRDHNPAVGDKVYKAGALKFLERIGGSAD